MTVKSKIKVLIIDDSAVVRTMLTNMLGEDPQIEVVGTAIDAYMARDKIKKLNPDVLTLDVEMPKMDGITFLSNLMRLHPMPVLMVSTLTEKGTRITMDALSYGAVDFVCKPKIDISHTFLEYAEELREKVKAVAKARVRQYVEKPAQMVRNGTNGPSVKYSVDEVIPGAFAPRKHFRSTHRVSLSRSIFRCLSARLSPNA
jgi:two-component system chemotaxis response regulator CheB